MLFRNTYLGLVIFILSLTPILSTAQINPRWIQQSAISPDGKWIAFEYQGNLFKVPYQGGSAMQLSSNSFYTGYPVWSHNSQMIAFAAQQNGNFDVYLMKAEGGPAKRLTCNSSRDIPSSFSANDAQVIFGTDRHDVYTSVRFPEDDLFNKLYQVSVKGGTSIMVSSAGMDDAHLNKKGDQLIFQDKKGEENNYRKHHTSSVTRDIWTYNLTTKVYHQVSTFHGEDLEPVWGHGNTIYYLSERSGTLNLCKGSVSDTATVKQLTHFKDNPVRNLSRADNGHFVFTFNGDLYSLTEGKQPQKISVTLDSKQPANSVIMLPVKGDITEMTVAEDGKQVAFIFRGDLFVTSADGTMTKQITSTPYQERNPKFSSDGKKLLYAVEHLHSWDIEQVEISTSYFFNAEKINTTSILASDKDEFGGVYAPDGSKIAYIENRDILKCYDLKTKTTRTLIPEGVNFASSDHDYDFKWSPDSQYLLAQSSEGGGGFDNEVVLIKDDGSGKRVNLTQSGFKDDQPQWGMDGNMMYWLSDKDANRSFTGDSQKDIYGLYFDRGTISMQQDKDFPVKKLSTTAADIAGSALSPDGEKLFYLVKYEEDYDLWVTSLKTHKNTLVAKLDLPAAKMQMTKDGKYLFVLSRGNIIRISTDQGMVIPLAIHAEMEFNAGAEREYIFNHTWQMVRKRYMDPALNGVNWDSVYQHYHSFLPDISNDEDFLVLLNEFLGELNTSHTLARYRPSYAQKDETAAMGLLYDETWKGKGLLVKEIISNGPFDFPGSKMKPDMIIDKINGTSLTRAADWAINLNHQSGKSIPVSFHDLKGGPSFIETIVPVKPETETYTLLYDRWVKTMEHLTDSLSGGKIGYVHIRSMTEDGFRVLYDKALGKYKNKAAIIVDTRFNRGGSLHDELTTFLSGKIYLTERRQGRITNGGEPIKKWTKPSTILMSEGNYSDAFLTPYSYKLMGIGKLIGMPVPGTGTGSWFEQEVNQQLYIQIATAGTYGPGATHPTENHQLEPDIKVKNDYQQILSGKDQQLAAAVLELLKTVQE
ncbi:S41 family peptidase [Pedobacter sp. L105]|uniref:S41 family peptidase n=1 Tax=Pedobacter sp. L105 TaxID=1641871 RepID=UPI00131B7ADE|nr:S41 family peptidase [Pedobacter sp. L105]